jgi:hypothetical protein
LIVNEPKNNIDFRFAPFGGGEAMIFEVEYDKNARLFKSNDIDNLILLKKYYDDLGNVGEAFYSHTFMIDNYLIQMNGEIEKEVFSKYVVVMKRLINRKMND